MNKRGITQRLVYLMLSVLLVATGCVPALSQRNETETITTDTDEIVRTVLAQVEADLAQQNKVVPAIYAATPAAAAASQVADLQDALIQLYQRANPAVVYIIVSPTLSGSGFVYSKDGYIVTNHHVVSAGQSYEVVFANGERQRAELIGSDADSDLAVLKVDALPDGVTPLSLADADQIQVGQFAVAIGNPFGEQGSMSLGIVSGLGRSLPSQRATTGGSTYSLPQVIQTDAPINPGNSGGPLLNLDGEVIGLNAAIASTTGANSGVGFSIPVAAIARIVPGLIEDAKYTYPYIGASFDSEISLDEQAVYGVSQTQGAYVVSVTPGGPADQAGLVAANPQTGHGGDLIVDMDGQAISSFSDLNEYLVFHAQVGQTIAITVLRGGEYVQLALVLGARP
ncbi:MAG: trypsin-like peptidase domain-containing protein [Anaerolineae bacterium]|nr:trypsin-like peptidase domain-containing protein [Anaerolineae bacterium]